MKPKKFISCTLKVLPSELAMDAAAEARRINPANAMATELFCSSVATDLADLEPQHLAVLTRKTWSPDGVKLSVSFLDNPTAELRRMILEQMYAWSRYANVTFAETAGTGQVRIARTPGQGYYSFLGTDILSIPTNQPTLNLDSFTVRTPPSEFIRVVRHETGHTLGAPHEHLRRELVDRIDPEKAIAYFGRTQGWSATMVRQQVLTPLDELSIRGTPHDDEDSIMTYALPGVITKDGRPIRGGVDIDALDQAFIGTIYPLVVQPPPPPGGPIWTGTLAAGTYQLTKV